jgi:hypothetical protein
VALIRMGGEEGVISHDQEEIILLSFCTCLSLPHVGKTEEIQGIIAV